MNTNRHFRFRETKMVNECGSILITTLWIMAILSLAGLIVQIKTQESTDLLLHRLVEHSAPRATPEERLNGDLSSAGKALSEPDAIAERPFNATEDAESSGRAEEIAKAPQLETTPIADNQRSEY